MPMSKPDRASCGPAGSTLWPTISLRSSTASAAPAPRRWRSPRSRRTSPSPRRYSAHACPSSASSTRSARNCAPESCGAWRCSAQSPGVEIVKPQPDEIALIGKAYQRILDTQQGNAADTAGLRKIAAELQRRDGVEAILLAGTDLAVIFDEATAGFPAIDVARLHIDAIVERLID